MVKAGQAAAVTAEVLGIPKASLSRCVLSERGSLNGVGNKPVTVEQMELARLLAEPARMTIARVRWTMATPPPIGKAITGRAGTNQPALCKGARSLALR